MEAGRHPSAWTRPLRRWLRPFLDAQEKQRIAELIEELERRTTGEIHVHVVGRAGQDVLHSARRVFAQLGLDKTDGRNAVLILVSHLDHRFAIWGDIGIHDQAGQRLWERAARAMGERFRERRYFEGVAAGVREVGAELARHFPKTDEGPGKNQISNEVTGS